MVPDARKDVFCIVSSSLLPRYSITAVRVLSISPPFLPVLPQSVCFNNSVNHASDFFFLAISSRANLISSLISSIVSSGLSLAATSLRNA